jgi:hypothetical protein
MDVYNVDQTSETIAVFQPDIIFCAVTLQPWLTISKLPQPIFEKLSRAQPGPWLPLTLAPVYKLMQAVKQTGLDVKVINASYPDSTNAVLSQVGLAPLIGIGNLANSVPAMRKSVAIKLSKPLEQVEVFLVGHHYFHHCIGHFGTPGGAPFHLTALVNGENVTPLLHTDTLFDLFPTILKRESGQLLTAASAMIVFEALSNKTSQRVHAPGPNGHVGAYPVSVQEGIPEIVLPAGLTMEQAIRINESGQRLDGIEQIEMDGTVRFTQENMEILTKIFGYHCRSMVLADVDSWATELQTKYALFAGKFT